MSAPLVLRHRPGDAAPDPARIGGKAHNLARLGSVGVEVPRWVVVTVDAFREHLLSAAPLPDTSGGLAEWRTRVRQEISLPATLLDAIRLEIKGAGLNGSLLAVRSSAVGEDAASASFAGQFDTVLGVRADGLDEAVRAVWASVAGEHAVAYGGEPPAMAVVIQEMVDAEVSGVAFGAEPVSGSRDLAVVSAVYGLGEGLVSGELDADTFRVDFSVDPPAVAASLAPRTEEIRLVGDGGTERRAVESDRTATLTEREVIEIATAVRRIGHHFGGPQDVEWALEAGTRRLRILQSRPITGLPEADGERRVWDNSNIIESYSGITSPLTFSFARAVYEDVYRQFCAVVGVPDALVERHREVFANMLGLVRGRVYYQLLNWYRTLALLPGYAVNRAFMERMMGVGQKLDDPPVLEATSGKVGDSVRLARMVARLVRQSRGLRRAVPAFHARIDAALAPLAGEDLRERSPDRLVALYRELEEELLHNWETPLVNDFFAMIWFGVLGRLVESWLPDAPPTLINDLLTHEGGIVSTEPARRVMGLAAMAAETPAVLARFEAEPDDAALARLISRDPDCAAFAAEVRTYLERFGDRCMNELKLETVTLGEEPGFLYQTIRSYLAGGVTPPDSAREGEVRRAAEARVARSLRGVRLRTFRLVLAQARARVRDRENLRFERTRVFGLVRRIFVALGHRLHAAGSIETPRDIFHLRVEEIFGHVQGTSTGADLAGLVRLRREEWERYEEMPPPPDRFESFGPVADGRWIVPAASAPPADGAGLRGIGCCPGVVRAPVRLVRDPRDAGDLAGRILVAARTDPGWTLLFPAAKGLLVERGSLLSHSAIVAREVGLPCVVSIPGLMETLSDGELVEMDGTTGLVRRLDG
jgi:rifampicin phosphotransferase